MKYLKITLSCKFPYKTKEEKQRWLEHIKLFGTPVGAVVKEIKAKPSKDKNILK